MKPQCEMKTQSAVYALLTVVVSNDSARDCVIMASAGDTTVLENLRLLRINQIRHFIVVLAERRKFQDAKAYQCVAASYVASNLTYITLPARLLLMDDSDKDGRSLFRVPEILLLLFEGLTQSQLVNAALVCKPWSSLALDTLWRAHPVRMSTLLSMLVTLTWPTMFSGKVRSFKHVSIIV